MIKAVIFDLSDVCFSAEEPPFIRAFARKHRIPFAPFEREYVRLLHIAENGKMSGEDLWRQLLKKYNISADPKKLIADMIAGKKEKKATLALAEKLRASGYKTAYFTNYNEDYWKPIAKMFNLKKYFDFGLVSYEIGARKPAPKGFLHIMSKLGVRPSETVFIDDSRKNLRSATTLGIQTVQFTGIANLRKKLRTLKVL